MNDAFLLTVLIGGGLLVCGYSLGRISGMTRGAKDVVDELFKTGLLTPEKLLAHYSKQGNDRARAALKMLNDYKREQEKKDEDNG